MSQDFKSVTVGELAQKLDIAPADALSALIRAESFPLCHGGRAFTTAWQLWNYIHDQQDFVPSFSIKDISVDHWNISVAIELAQELGCEAGELQ